MKTLPFAALALTVLVAGCNAPEPTEEKPPKPQGREETRTIRNTDAIGYSGGAIANKVDASLDANDRRKETLDEALEGSE